MLSNLVTMQKKISFEPTQTFFRKVRAIQKGCQNNYSRRRHLLQILPALGSRVPGIIIHHHKYTKRHLNALCVTYKQTRA